MPRLLPHPLPEAVNPALPLALLGLLSLALGLLYPKGLPLRLGGGAYLLAVLLEALRQGPLMAPAQVALLLGALLALRAGTLLDRPRLAPLRDYLLLVALALGLFALRALPHPAKPLPLGLTLLHAGAFLLAYLSLTVGVGAGVLAALQGRWLKENPARALSAPPFWSLKRLARGYLGPGYLALTLGLGSGMAWAWGYFGTPLSPDPKELGTFLAWVFLGLHLALEDRLPPRGALCCLLLGYGLLLFALLLAPLLGSRHPSAL